MSSGDRARLQALLKQAEKEGLGDYIWDPDFVRRWSTQMDTLNQELNETEEQTRTINRRQEALGLEISDFPELQRLRNDIKPLSQLWEAITQFNGVIEDWKSKPIC